MPYEALSVQIFGKKSIQTWGIGRIVLSILRKQAKGESKFNDAVSQKGCHVHRKTKE